MSHTKDDLRELQSKSLEEKNPDFYRSDYRAEKEYFREFAYAGE